MATATFDDIKLDGLALAIGRAVALASAAAQDHGMDANEMHVSITDNEPDEPLWRISFGPKNYRKQRGGGLLVFVEKSGEAVREVLRCQ